MADYIDREAFLDDRRAIYCADCGRRKGMKNGKIRFCYEIGGPPCRACGIDDMFDDIEDYPAADVVERKRGEWISVEDRMPEEPFACLLIVEDCVPFTGEAFPNYLPYFAGWDGEQWNDADGEQVPFEVLYWMPLPKIPEVQDG